MPISAISLSPLSDTAGLPPQLAEVDLRAHIRAMYWTAGPAFIIACVVFTILGLRERGIADGAYVASELTRLNELFWITPLNLIPLIFLVVLAIRKVPPSLAILSSALLAGVMGALLQPQAVLRLESTIRRFRPRLRMSKEFGRRWPTAIGKLQASRKWTASFHGAV